MNLTDGLLGRASITMRCILKNCGAISQKHSEKFDASPNDRELTDEYSSVELQGLMRLSVTRAIGFQLSRSGDLASLSIAHHSDVERIAESHYSQVKLKTLLSMSNLTHLLPGDPIKI
jgi:hypothetical protein